MSKEILLPEGDHQAMLADEARLGHNEAYFDLMQQSGGELSQDDIDTLAEWREEATAMRGIVDVALQSKDGQITSNVEVEDARQSGNPVGMHDGSGRKY